MYKNIKPSVNSHLIELLQAVQAEFIPAELTLNGVVRETHQSSAETSFKNDLSCLQYFVS